MQDIFYVKLDKDKIVESFKFCVELIKGKLTHITSSLGKNGFCYQYYIQSYYEEDLPKTIPIKINNNDIIYLNPDKNENKLKEIFTIINVPEQNIKDIFNISNNNKIDNKIEGKYDWKYVITINKDREKDFQKFDKILVPDGKKKFSLSKDIQASIKTMIETCKNNPITRPLKGIDYNRLNKVMDSIIDLKEGFQKFEFENTKNDYEIIKDCILMILYFYSDELGYLFNYYITNYDILLKEITNLDYIDRIKILICFIVNTLLNINKKKYFFFL